MWNKKVNCLVCEKEISKKEALKESGSYFCSPECKKQYQEELKKVGDSMHLDDCC